MATYRKRGSTWYCQYVESYDSNNKKIIRQKGGFRIKQDAINYAKNAEVSLRSGSYVNPVDKTTVSEWIDDYIKLFCTTQRPNTIASYTNTAKHIKEKIGNKKISDVTVKDVQQLYNSVEAEISPYTAIQVARVLCMAFKKATESKMIHDNPTIYAKKPKKPECEQRVYSTDQIGMLMNSIHDPASPYRCLFAPILLCVTLGLRRGEALGLKWSDYKDGKIWISDALINNNRDKRIDLADVKTHRSNRPIAVGPFIASILTEQQQWQASNRQKIGDEYILSNSICTLPGGMPMKPNYLTHRFDMACEKAKLDHIRLHDLRHTMASVANAEGIDIKKVSSRLGHSSISITADTYTHMFAEVDQTVSNTIENAIENSIVKAKKKKVK
ncbi:MAG: tyrosine-type recombinase/integrase [Selenomonadaceae bacterium]